jgi:hypothetical protein
MDPVLREMLEEELAHYLGRHDELSGHLISLQRQTEDSQNERDKIGARITSLRTALENADE